MEAQELTLQQSGEKLNANKMTAGVREQVSKLWILAVGFSRI